MMEDDPIKVFKKIYGDEAYNKAGSFPGAFEIGENFNHYESIFKENMGENILKVKDKKYVGDGKLLLTESEEVRTPIKDEDVPFATGGRASFAGGKFIDEIVLMITKKEPMDAMKEVNKIIGKKGKYKNLTQKDIDRIVDQLTTIYSKEIQIICLLRIVQCLNKKINQLFLKMNIKNIKMILTNR